MHSCLNVDEILRLIACELAVSGAKATTVSLACCCKSFEDPVLDALWETQGELFPLLKSLPGNAWKVEAAQFSFTRLPTKVEWIRIRKYARGIRSLTVDATKDLMTSDVLLALQSRAGDEPLFPRLEVFECMNATRDFTPFIPLFLSPKTTDIRISFTPNFPTVIAALTIPRFPTLCPRIRRLTLRFLPRDPVVVEAVSEMLLACNRDTLQTFSVNCPLTKEARRFLCTLPNLRRLRTVVQGPTSLPPLALPELDMFWIEWNSGRDWLQAFRGATIGKLKTAIFCPVSRSSRISGFLEEFESVALTTSAPNTLSALDLYTSQSWSPNYSSLLVFKQMTKLKIEFSCHNGCSSTVDDDVIINLAQAMPGLEILKLGGQPCRAPSDVTFKGLIALALRCPQLSHLRVHFQASSLAEATSRTEPPPLSEPTPGTPQTNCALKVLEVGETPVAEQETLAVGITLLQLFPKIVSIECFNAQWRSVAETIKLFKRISGNIRHARKMIVEELR